MLDVRQPEREACSGLCDSPVDRSWPRSEGLSIHENRKRKAQREDFWIVSQGRPRELGRSVLVAGNNSCGACGRCYSSVIELGIVG